MIEEREINGKKIGYDTERYSFCALPEAKPQERTDPPKEPKSKAEKE